MKSPNQYSEYLVQKKTLMTFVLHGEHLECCLNVKINY